MWQQSYKYSNLEKFFIFAGLIMFEYGLHNFKIVVPEKLSISGLLYPEYYKQPSRTSIPKTCL